MSCQCRDRCCIVSMIQQELVSETSKLSVKPGMFDWVAVRHHIWLQSSAGAVWLWAPWLCSHCPHVSLGCVLHDGWRGGLLHVWLAQLPACSIISVTYWTYVLLVSYLYSLHLTVDKCRSNDCNVMMHPHDHIFIKVCWPFSIMVESPVWTAARGNYEQAQESLMKIARWNRVPTSGIRLKQIGDDSADESDSIKQEHNCHSEESLGQRGSNDEPIPPASTITFLDLFKDGVLRTLSLVSIILWYVLLLPIMYMLRQSKLHAWWFGIGECYFVVCCILGMTI